MTGIIALLSGVAAGGLHVFSGPDHLAAVAPLSIDRPRLAWRSGLRWGLGHAAGVMMVGLFALAFREALPIDSVSSWAERLVGVVLVVIGLWGIRNALQGHLHTHEHAHGAERHVHIHFHIHPHHHAGPNYADTLKGGHRTRGHTHTHAAVAIGALHGIAGSSHFLAIVPALAFANHFQAVLFLGGYGVGAVAAMVCFSSVVGFCSRTLASLPGRPAKAGTPNGLYRGLMLACSVTAIGLGCFWMAGF